MSVARALSADEEIALSDRLARGDRQALSALYEIHGGAVFAVALRVLRDRADAADVTQETFLEAWRSAKHYQPERARIGTWLITIGRSRAIDRLRSRSSAQRTADAARPISEPTAGSADVELERRWERHVVRRHLLELPDEQRSVLELAWNEGLSQSEIAHRTGIPLGTVKTRTRQGLLRLAAALRAQRT